MTAPNAQTQLTAPKNNKQLAEYIHTPTVLEKFAALMPFREANAYIQSVLIACAANPDLMDCTPESVVRSALRAASLELSCDPAMKQAQLVPIKGKAEFWPHYRGLYTLMVRTGKYYAINVTPVREGQRVMQHTTTGIHYLVLENGLMVENDKLSKLVGQGYQDVTAGANGKKIIGYLGYFETNTGFKKTIYMSLSDIAEHAEIYAPSAYRNPMSPWNKDKGKDRAAMEMKTAFRELLKWADLTGKANATLKEALHAEEEHQWANDEDITDAMAIDAEVKAEEELPARPWNADFVKASLMAEAKKQLDFVPSKDQIGLMVGMIEQAFAPDKDSDKIRRSCLRFLWGVDSSKKMTGGQVKVTLDWLAPVKDSGGSYLIDAMAAQELHAVWTAANVEAGQGTLIP